MAPDYLPQNIKSLVAKFQIPSATRRQIRTMVRRAPFWAATLPRQYSSISSTQPTLTEQHYLSAKSNRYRLPTGVPQHVGVQTKYERIRGGLSRACGLASLFRPSGTSSHPRLDAAQHSRTQLLRPCTQRSSRSELKFSSPTCLKEPNDPARDIYH